MATTYAQVQLLLDVFILAADPVYGQAVWNACILARLVDRAVRLAW